MRPIKQEKLEFRNKCNCIVSYGLLEKAMLWYSGGTLMRNRTIFLHGKYPAVSIYEEKIHVHRLLVKYIKQDRVLSSIIVHHKDGNRINCSVDNLKTMSSNDHGSLHNKGKKLTKRHRMKISEAGKRRKGIKMKKKHAIEIEELKKMISDGHSINRIAKYYNCDWSTIKNRIHENPELMENK